VTGDLVMVFCAGLIVVGGLKKMTGGMIVSFSSRFTLVCDSVRCKKLIVSFLVGDSSQFCSCF
jgi:hypothetical protein